MRLSSVEEAMDVGADRRLLGVEDHDVTERLELVSGVIKTHFPQHMHHLCIPTPSL